jgi:uncharacterized protein (TIGR02996 family)
MTDEQAFVQAIQAAPADDAPRLIYADWLEERGELGGEYLRLEAFLASTPPRSRKAKELRGRLQELHGRLRPDWLAVFEQPALMHANLTPFPAGWWSVELEGYREAAGTYGLFPYDSLPPLPAGKLRGDFRWLKGSRNRAAPKPKPSKKLDRLDAAARALDLKLPREFAVLMGSSSLRRRVRSCTDCFFNWPQRIADSPGGEGGHLVRFYSDSQGCLHWYLYLTDKGYSCVVASGGFFGSHEGDPEGEDWDDPSGEFWFCGPSLEEFIYRTWIENEIWSALSDDDGPLTPEEEAYLNHYRRA